MRVQSDSIRNQVRVQVRLACTRPGVRHAVKLLLDAGFAAVAWVAALSLVRSDFPSPISVIEWVAFAMVVNITFQHTRQHYRFTGFEEVRSLMLSMMTMIAKR